MNDFVFRRRAGIVEYVGDFEGLYKSEADPWEQSGKGTNATAEYYAHSRNRLIEGIDDKFGFAPVHGIEIGCGHGYVTDLLASWFFRATWSGMDISPSAIAIAKEKYPHLSFMVGDIAGQGSLRRDWYEVIVLNQVLWYLLHKIDDAVAECISRLRLGGVIVISQAFLRDQRYGRDIAEGFHGTARMMVDKFSDHLRLVYADQDVTGKFTHDDGLLMFRRYS